jgi:hypothetical protein
MYAAYQYWKDLWANRQKPPKPRRPRTLPVYLEPEEQQALLEAAVAAGVPRHLAEGDKSRQVGGLSTAAAAAVVSVCWDMQQYPEHALHQVPVIQLQPAALETCLQAVAPYHCMVSCCCCCCCCCCPHVAMSVVSAAASGTQAGSCHQTQRSK